MAPDALLTRCRLDGGRLLARDGAMLEASVPIA
jgi:hypothetical protein